MKKIFVIVMLLIVVFAFAESYEYDGDVWNFYKTYQEEGFIFSAWDLDMEKTNWIGIDPVEIGLLAVSINIGRDFQKKELFLVVVYKTIKQYYTPNFILVDKNRIDFSMIGGRGTEGDIVETTLDGGIFTTTIAIGLTKDNIELLNEDLYFSILESGSDHNIYYGIPQEVFDISFNMLGMR